MANPPPPLPSVRGRAPEGVWNSSYGVDDGEGRGVLWATWFQLGGAAVSLVSACCSCAGVSVPAATSLSSRPFNAGWY